MLLVHLEASNSAINANPFNFSLGQKKYSESKCPQSKSRKNSNPFSNEIIIHVFNINQIT